VSAVDAVLIPESRPAEYTAAPQSVDARPFQFTGSAGEYFRIWIVNLVLSIVTLGVYSAWAKVRRLRYFYGHTVLDGHRFGYHASPIAILKGRLVAYAVVAALAVLGQVAPIVVVLAYLPLIALMPFVIARGLRFHAVNSSYRGIRFGFDGRLGEAYAVFLGWLMLAPFTLWLIYPYVVKRQREFVVNNSRHGLARMRLSLVSEKVYVVYLVGALAAGGALVLGVIAIASIVMAVTAGGRTMGPEPPAWLGFTPLIFYAAFGAVAVGVRTSIENLVWNGTSIEGHAFRSELGIGRMIWLYGTNLLAIAATLGLAVPWARVRLARYRAGSLALLPGGPLAFNASPEDELVGAAGSEFSEAMEFDVGL
jgi:uncharacterized membrane protein YjgN (DUF898 family)